MIESLEPDDDDEIAMGEEAAHDLVQHNWSWHKVNGVREMIEAAEAELLYPPPDLPDLNPNRKSLVQTEATAPIGQSQDQRGSR
jgi:hypothetical protein